VSFLVWVAGFFTNKISWRGLEYRVKKGLLVPVTPAAPVLRVGDEKRQN
jgi:hypothetical protein